MFTVCLLSAKNRTFSQKNTKQKCSSVRTRKVLVNGLSCGICKKQGGLCLKTFCKKQNVMLDSEVLMLLCSVKYNSL